MSDTEKITINISVVDLGKIDLLVQEGLYTNRTDCIRTAIRNQINSHSYELQQSISRNNFGIGILSYNRKELEQAEAEGKRIRLTLIGMLALADDVTPELARRTIESIRLLGVLRAPDAVTAALADRMK